MATGNPYVGRREGVGLGIEATPGTPVAPQTWLRWLDQDLQNKTTVAENESAIGVSAKVSDSAVTQKWAEGKVGGKVTDAGIGYWLLGFFGTVSTGTVVSGIYPHTFSMNDSSTPTALTIALAGPLKTQRFSYTTVESLEFSAESGGWVTMEAKVKARGGATASDTVALASELEFTSKNITVKTAANTAGLTGATALKVKSTKVTLNRASDNFFPLGTDDVPEFDRGEYEFSGEFVVRYTDTGIEDDFLGNVTKAMEIKLANGTTNLTFTAPRVKFRQLDKNVDRDKVVTQTVSFYWEFDTATNAAVVPVLNNATTDYVHA